MQRFHTFNTKVWRIDQHFQYFTIAILQLRIWCITLNWRSIQLHTTQEGASFSYVFRTPIHFMLVYYVCISLWFGRRFIKVLKYWFSVPFLCTRSLIGNLASLLWRKPPLLWDFPISLIIHTRNKHLPP